MERVLSIVVDEQMTKAALHAWKICLKHPLTGQKLEFTAPLPADMHMENSGIF